MLNARKPLAIDDIFKAIAAHNYMRIAFGHYHRDIREARKIIREITKPIPTEWKSAYMSVRKGAYRLLNAYLDMSPRHTCRPVTSACATVHIALGEMNRRDSLRYGNDWIFRLSDRYDAFAREGCYVRYAKNARLRNAVRAIRKALGPGLWQYLD